MKRKILAGVLSLCMMISLFPTAAFAEEVQPMEQPAVEEAAVIETPAEEVAAEETETPAEETTEEAVEETVVEETTEETVEETVTEEAAKEIAPTDVAKIGDTGYATLALAAAAAQAGDEIVLLSEVTENVTLPADVIFNGNGKQINGSLSAGGNLTLKGHTLATSFSAGYYNRTITIGEGACLELTGTGRITIGYGNTFNITGSISDAKTTDKAAVQPSLIVPGGSSITGGNGAAFNVTNAYIIMGNTSSKNSAANGTFDIDFTNSIAEFTHQFTLSAPTGSLNPTFNVNIKDSVFTSVAKICLAAPGSNVVIDNSNVSTANNLHNSGNITLKNDAVFTGNTIQFGENGGNAGTITVDNSTFNVNAANAAHAFDGNGTGKIIVKNGGKADVDYITNSDIEVDLSSNLTATDLLGETEVTVDTEGYNGTPTEVLTITNTANLADKIKVGADDNAKVEITGDGKVVVKAANVAQIGTTKYPTLQAAINAAKDGDIITLLADAILEDTITIENSITIEGNNHKLIPADADKTYNSAIMAGNSGWGDDHGETITLNNLDISGWKTNYGVVRAQGVTLEMNGCSLNDNSVSNDAYGVLSLNFADAAVTDCEFIKNGSRAVDINYNGDNSNSEVVIDQCKFIENNSTGAGIVVRNDGEKLTVKNSEFTGNTVNTNGNAATIYAGWGAQDEISNCTFSGNTVTTSHTTTKRFASAIFCDGCTVAENVFEGNSATRAGEGIATTVAVGAYYGPADISGNYWGKTPVAGVDYTVEYTRNPCDMDTYYEDKALTNEVVINSVAEVNGKPYAKLDKAIAAATASGETVTLVSDITLTETITVPAGVTLTAAEGVKIYSDVNQAIRLEGTLENLTIVNTADNNASPVNTVYMMDGSKVENCNFTGNYAAGDGEVTRAIEVAPGANATITGNTFKNLRQPAYINNGATGTVSGNHTEGTRGFVVCSDSEMTITGNSFGENAVDICIIKSGTENNYSEKTLWLSEVNDGAHVEDQCGPSGNIAAENGKWVINDTYTFENLIAAAAATESKTLVLTEDVQLSKQLNVKTSGVTIDGNGHTIYAADDFAGDYAGNLSLVKFENVTGVTLKDVTIRTNDKCSNALDIFESEVTLENVTLDNQATKGGAPLIVNGSDVTVEGELNLKVGSNSWYGVNVSDKNGTDAELTFADGSELNIEGESKYPFDIVVDANNRDAEDMVAFPEGMLCESDNGAVYTEHTMGEWQSGVNGDTRVCTVCGHSETRGHRHVYGGWYTTKEATCCAAGVEAHVCTVCNHGESRSIAATGHHFDINGVCAGCGFTEAQVKASTPSRVNPNTGVHF